MCEIRILKLKEPNGLGTTLNIYINTLSTFFPIQDGALQLFEMDVMECLLTREIK